MENKKYKIALNNIDKIEQLLQETYDLASQQSKQIQDEINKITKITILTELDIDGKEKYAKAVNNYLALLQKSTNQKLEIAKLMSEIVKHNGDVDGALKDNAQSIKTFDIKKLKSIASTISNGGDVESYKLK